MSRFFSPSLARSFALPLLCLSLAACSFVVDFDRSKIDDANQDSGMGDGDGQGDGDIGDMDASADSNVPPVDSGNPDSGDESDATMAECEVHEDCGANGLCCQGMCKDTSKEECLDCGQGCGEGASTCAQRSCLCGTSGACSGDKPFCTGTAGAEQCAECRVSEIADCMGRSDGKDICVGGTCAECDPTDNTGCGTNKPICNPTSLTCEACTSSNEASCPGDGVCTASGGCGGCSTNEAMMDCTNPSAPICDATSTECKACTGNGTSQLCSQQQGKAYCVNNERCSPCMPEANTGCGIASATPDCRLDGNQFKCQGCENSAEGCKDATRNKCTSTGSCVQCEEHSDCTDPTKPLCDGDGLCKACQSVTGSGVNCGAKTTDTVCSSANDGRCVQCNGAGECSDEGALTICSAHVCVQCTGNANCGNDVCSATMCVNCSTDANCTGHPTGGQCVDMGGGNTECRACDPKGAGSADDEGCTGLQICNPTTYACQNVECLGDQNCTTSEPICLNNVCVQCTAADVDACPAATDTNACTTPGCSPTNTCTSTPVTPVSDGLACTTDTCNPANGQPIYTSTCAADNSACTTATCTATGCEQTPNNTACNDDINCTTDTCTATSGTGCSNVDNCASGTVCNMLKGAAGDCVAPPDAGI